MSASVGALQLEQQLLDKQNGDGGWSFTGRGLSWTEPTALALLALATQNCPEACYRARVWLERSQRADGGWSPRPCVPLSTWVTSLAALALVRHPDWMGLPRTRALQWLCQQAKPLSSPAERFFNRLQGGPVQADAGLGASWFPGTSAWLYPTAMSILTFTRAEIATGDRQYGALARAGQEFLLSRRCRDGGWNHGGSHFMSEDAPSYPETTGVALLALGGVAPDELAYPLKRAQSYLRSPNSLEGLCWLHMALARHQISSSELSTKLPARTPRDLALHLLALNVINPRNGLLMPHLPV